MNTIKDVLASHEKLEKFRDHITLVSMSATDPNAVEVLNNIDVIFARRFEISEEATALFRAVGEQVCADHGVEWGTPETEHIPRDAKLSAKAKVRHQKFLKFIEQHS